MKKLKQKHYGTIEVDQREKDVIIIWGSLDTDDPQCVHVCREDLDKFVKILTDARKL